MNCEQGDYEVLPSGQHYPHMAPPAVLTLLFILFGLLGSIRIAYQTPSESL